MRGYTCQQGEHHDDPGDEKRAVLFRVLLVRDVVLFLVIRAVVGQAGPDLRQVRVRSSAPR